MKKLLLTALGAFCFGSFAFAQDGAKVAPKKKATPVAAKAKAPSLVEATSQESRQKAKELDFQKQQQATAPQQQRKNALAAEKVER